MSSSYDIVVTSRVGRGNKTAHHFALVVRKQHQCRCTYDQITGALTIEGVAVGGRRYELRFSRDLTDFLRRSIQMGEAGAP